MPPILAAASIEGRALQPVASEQPLFFPRLAVKVLTHVMDLTLDHQEPGLAELQRGLDAGTRRHGRVVEADLVSKRHQENRSHVGGPSRKHAMGAGLAAPYR